MIWPFKTKTQPVITQNLDRQAMIDIETHADAKAEAVAEAKEASRKLNTLLVENGFTLKIYLAAGHKADK